MKVLFTSRNLLGDGLQATPAIVAYDQKFKPEEILVLGTGDYTDEIYDHILPNVRRVSPVEVMNQPRMEEAFNFDIQRAWSVGIPKNIPACVAFGEMLGVTVDPLPVFHASEKALVFAQRQAADQPYVVFHSYTVCCTSWTGGPPNKRWRDECWADLYARIKTELGLRVMVLGGPLDAKTYFMPGIERADHHFGLPLDTVAGLQKHAALVVTLDCGAAHLAASQRANMIELYPSALPSNWMSNLANENLTLIHTRPWDVPVADVWRHVQNRVKHVLAVR